VRGLLIGRFQPFHHGHLSVLREIRTNRPNEELLLAIGSAQDSYTWRNPFTAGERMEMIGRALREAELTGVVPVPIPDIDRHAVWVRYVESFLPHFERVYTNNPLTRLLFEQARYTVESPRLVDRALFEGETIRGLMAAGGEWKSHVPGAVVRFLEEIDAAQRLKILREGEAPSAR